MATITGTNNNDTLNGTSSDDTINARAGNDILFGAGGLDILNGDSGKDRFDITGQAQIVAGETYNGGLGFDTLFLNTTNAINLSSTIINSVESLLANGAVSLTSAQLDGFVRLQTGTITLTNGGVVDLSGANVLTTTFNLNSAGNTLNLGDVTTASYTVNGSGGVDIVTGGENADVLNGGGGNDTLSGGGGNDTITGGAGKDTVDGGAGNDRFVIIQQSDIVAAENYTGGTGVDTLDLETFAAIDISSLTINADVEALESGGTVSLTASQLNNFKSVLTGAITLTTTGTVSFVNATVSTDTFILNAGGNVLDLGGQTAAGYTVTGSGVADTVTGGENGDNLNGGGGGDTLSGGGGDDTITGAAGLDIIDGGAGNDHFIIGQQNQIVAGESYNGGSGFDTLDLQTGSTIDISALTINSDVECLVSGGAVSLTAAQLDAFTQLQTGAITLTTGGSVSFLNDTVPTNTFNLNAAGNTLDLGGCTAGSYIVNGDAAGDVITGGDNADTLNGGGGIDTLNGGGGGDTITGGGGKDFANGGAGNDRFVITAQGDIVAGESYTGGTGLDTLDLETGSPIDLSSITISSDVERLESNGTISLTAAQLGNFISVQSATITLTTAGGVSFVNDTVFTNTFILNDAGNTFDLSGQTVASYTVAGSAGTDTIIGGENGDIVNGGGGNDTLNGGGGGDVLIGGAGMDIVNGGIGADRLTITQQSDLVAGESYSGGSGFDILDLATATPIDLSAVTINPNIERLEADGSVSLTAAQLDAFTNIQTGTITLATTGGINFANADVFTPTFNLNAGGNTFDLTGVTKSSYTVNGGAAADVITGSENADALIGGDGDDTLNGGGGNDTITGGAGTDVVTGGNGDDRFVISAQSDIVAGESYNGGSGSDILDLETAAAINIASLSINANVEQLESGGAVSLKAVQLDKFTSVQTGAITLTSNGLVDLTDAVVLTNTFNLNAAGNIFDLTGVTDASYTVIGKAGVDIITGGDNNDTLSGGDGNDMLNGSFGNDALTGGVGQDSFLFNTDIGGVTNIDTVFDFSSVDDKVLLGQSVFAAAGAVGTLTNAAFFIGPAAHDADDRIIYDSGTGALLYDPDGTGATAATQFAALSSGLALTRSNFQIV